MPQLDRFLNILVSNNATALNLAEGDVATVTIKDSARPVMKQPLTSAQILTLVREIAPTDSPRSLDLNGGMRFEYTTADGTFEVSLTQNGKISARIERKAPSQPSKDSAASASRVEPTPVEAAPAAARTPSVPTANLTGNRALDRIENLLRLLVANKASDLHLRSGSPPMLRASGEIAPIPNEAIMSWDDIDEILAAMMLDHNRSEFKELNDTDFAHEIHGIARFRCNALRDRKGTGAVFRAIPAAVVTVD